MLAQGPLLTASGSCQLEEGEGGSQAAGPQDPALLGKTERGELPEGELSKAFPPSCPPQPLLRSCVHADASVMSDSL